MTTPGLARRLGTVDAVVIGLGSMIGAGVFAAFAPAAAAAGSALLFGLALAAGVAYCNAVASAQLAARYPSSGGTYVYGRARLGEWWGFIAGWGFVIGKTASCAAMALTFAAYAIPDSAELQRGLAIAAVLGLTAVNLRGITRTAALTGVLVAGSLTSLAVVVVVSLSGGQADLGNLVPGDVPATPYGVLQSAGLLFFAFAGYARIATLGEEVREPERTIPRAIPVALGVAVAVYALVGTSALLVAGPRAIAAGATPLATAVEAAGSAWALPVVRAGAVVASLGSLLALIAGISRTALAMAREGDLPRPLAAVDAVYQVPARAQIAVAAAVIVLVACTDLRSAIGFSSFGVLIYYAIANAAAFTQPPVDRRWPRALNALGLVGCLVLVATLPEVAILAGLVMFAAGLLGRVVARRLGGAVARERLDPSGPDDGA